MLPILLENEAVKKIQTGLDYDPTEIEIALRDTFISVDTELHKLMKNYRRFAGKIYDCDSQSETELEALTWNLVGDDHALDKGVSIWKPANQVENISIYSHVSKLK